MVDYLKQVIIKIDFQKESNIIKEIDKNLEQEILKSFKLKEPKELKWIDFQLTWNEIKQNKIDKTKWFYYDENHKNICKIMETALLLIINEYEGYEKLKKLWSNIVSSFFNAYPNVQVIRFWLRYINSIELNDDKSKWKEIINENLLTNLDIWFNNLSRLFTVVNENNDWIITNFQYWFYNSDFPSVIKKHVFTLDYNMFINWIISKDDIISYTDDFHIRIKDLFNKSIIIDEW